MPVMRPYLAGTAAAAASALLARRLRRPHPIRGKVVLVTGGTRGLGLEIARDAARRGARVAVCGRDAATLDEAVRDLEARGAQVLGVRCDVGDPRAVEAMVADVERRLGPVEVLVACAGIITVGPVETQTRDDYVAAMDVMYWGAVNPALSVLPGMRDRGDGSIAVITSIGGRVAAPHLLPYTGAKFAAVGFAEGLAAEVARSGIRVTAVTPGLMRTGSQFNALFKGRHRAEFSWFSLAASLPLVSVDVSRAARRVLDAVERGEREASIGLPAAVGARLHGLMPGATVRALTVVQRLLPEPGGAGAQARSGDESRTAVSESAATALGRRAAPRQNQRTAARAGQEASR
jgi:NAD(P)-dependent dehydrogenase (short-subunit alcohol dehydrogenase family)